MSKLIPPRLCLECRDPFTPRKAEQKYCPKPSRCAYQAQSRLRRGQRPEAAIRGKRDKDATIRDEKLHGQFGVLSDREIALYIFSHRVGYDEGYQAAYAPLRAKAS